MNPMVPYVKVWDPFVRLAHWIVAFGCIANLSVLRDGREVHDFVGYAVLATVVLRLAWGVVGSAHARFRDFVPRPKQLLNYLQLMMRGREPRYVGHNPAGAVMMLTLMLLCIVCGVSGWMMGLDRFWGDPQLHAVHAIAANLILICAVVHVLGAVIESFRHQENIILAMVTGRKRPPRGTDVSNAPAAD